MTTLEQAILEAIKSFDFDDFGCDEMVDLVKDPDLDIGPELAKHIATALGVPEQTCCGSAMAGPDDVFGLQLYRCNHVPGHVKIRNPLTGQEFQP